MHRRKRSVTLCLLFILLLFSSGPSRNAVYAAEGGSHGGYTWLVDNGTLTITQTVPDAVLTKPHGTAYPWMPHEASINKLVIKDMKLTDASATPFHELDHVTHIEGMNTLDISEMTTLKYMFSGMLSLEAIDVTGLNTSNVVNMQGVFSANPKLKTITGLASWDMRKVVTINSMLRELPALTQTSSEALGIEDWQLTSLRDLNSLFYRTRLTSLDLSNWAPYSSQFYNLHYTFTETNLSTLNISGWTIQNHLGNNAAIINRYSYLFNHTNLEELDLSLWAIRRDSQNATYETDNMFHQSPPVHRIVHLGNQFQLFSNGPLLAPENETYTGNWVAVGSGTVDAPAGQVLTNAELAALYDGSHVATLPVVETYVWQKKVVDPTPTPTPDPTPTPTPTPTPDPTPTPTPDPTPTVSSSPSVSSTPSESTDITETTETTETSATTETIGTTETTETSEVTTKTESSSPSTMSSETTAATTSSETTSETTSTASASTREQPPSTTAPTTRAGEVPRTGTSAPPIVLGLALLGGAGVLLVVWFILRRRRQK